MREQRRSRELSREAPFLMAAALSLVVSACGDSQGSGNGAGTSGASTSATGGEAAASGSSGRSAGGGSGNGLASSGTGGAVAGGRSGSGGSGTEPGRSGSGGGPAGGSGSTAGGRDAGAGVPAGAGVMPWDKSIYGDMPEGAVYIFAEPYVTIQDGRVIKLQNAANPGTHDMVFNADTRAPQGVETRPTWHARGGLNDRSYASFQDGQRGVAKGFNFDPDAGTHEVALQVVGRYTKVENVIGYGVIVTSADDYSWMATFSIRADDPNDLWRTNGDITNPPHNIDYLTPEASKDTSWQLHEGYAKVTGLLAFRNGVQFGPGGTGGPRPGHGVLDEVDLGGGYPSGSGGFAPIDVHELVVTEGRPLEQLAAYRARRVTPVYGLELE